MAYYERCGIVDEKKDEKKDERLRLAQEPKRFLISSDDENLSTIRFGQTSQKSFGTIRPSSSSGWGKEGEEEEEEEKKRSERGRVMKAE